MPQFPSSETVTVLGPLDFAGATSVRAKTNALSGTALSDDTLTRAKLATESAEAYPVPPFALRVWDNLTAALPQTAGTDDLAIIEGTLGTDAPTIQSSDGKATTITQYARFQFVLPPEYTDQQNLVVRIRAGMITTISDGTATVDVQAYRHDEDGGVSADLCATAAQTINSLTKSNKDFTVTGSTLFAGDTLDIRLAVAITDTATGTAVIGEISRVAMLLDIKG
jgi:hypothetical protein